MTDQASAPHFHLAPAGLREQIVATIEALPVAYWTPGSIASRIMPAIGAAFDQYRDAIGTPDNPATSSDGVDSPLAERLRDALRDAALQARQDYKILSGLGSAPGPIVITGTLDELTAAAIEAVRPELARLADYENRITWHTTCASCARLLDSSYAETMRAEKAEAALTRIQALADEHPVAIPTNLVEEALDQTQEQP